MTNRVLDTAIDQAVDAAQGAVHAIGDGISELKITELLPTQLLPSRRSSRDRGRTVAVVSTLVLVAAGLMMLIAKRRRGAQHVHRDGSAYEETAEAAMASAGDAADRVMAAAGGAA